MKIPHFDHDAAWQQLPEELRDEAVKILRENLDEGFLIEVRDLVAKHGRHEWAVTDLTTPEQRREDTRQYGFSLPHIFHMNGGMGIRNLLRSHGMRDERLPLVPEAKRYYGDSVDKFGNWDDFYVSALEAAALVEDG